MSFQIAFTHFRPLRTPSDIRAHFIPRSVRCSFKASSDLPVLINMPYEFVRPWRMCICWPLYLRHPFAAAAIHQRVPRHPFERHLNSRSQPTASINLIARSRANTARTLYRADLYLLMIDNVAGGPVDRCPRNSRFNFYWCLPKYIIIHTSTI